MKKRKASLGLKVTLMIVIMALVLSVVAVLVSYNTYKISMEEHYIATGEALVDTLGSQLNPDDMRRYYETLEQDEAYDNDLKLISDFVNHNDVEYLYIIRPEGVGAYFLFDSDMTTGGYEAGGGTQLGDYIDFDETFIQYLDLFVAGKPVPPLITHGEYGWLLTVFSPLLDSNGEMVCYVLADISMNDVVQDRENFLVLLASLLVGITAIFAVLYVFVLQRSIVRPINMLAQYTSDFVTQSADQLSSGLVAQPDIGMKTGDEIENLANSIMKMESDIISYIHNLTAVTAEKERIGAELSVATQIQTSMLPCIFPAFPERRDFTVFASMEPAKEVGGDFYDFFLLDDDHLGIVTADVSGKGVPAALFMVIAKTLIKNYAQSGLSPADVFTQVNKQLCENNQAGMFVTAWMAVITLSTGEVCYANAGHNPPLVKSNGSYKWLKSRPGLVLAGMEGIKYKQFETKLAPGDMLLLYTDGLTEAMNPQQEFLGDARLEMILNQPETIEYMPPQLVEHLKKEVQTFADGEEQSDDITIVSMIYYGAG